MGCGFTNSWRGRNCSVVVVMVHDHVNGHVVMTMGLISLISLISISVRSEKSRFAVQSPRHGLDLGTAAHWPVRRNSGGPLCFFKWRAVAGGKSIVTARRSRIPAQSVGEVSFPTNCDFPSLVGTALTSRRNCGR